MLEDAEASGTECHQAEPLPVEVSCVWKMDGGGERT